MIDDKKSRKDLSRNACCCFGFLYFFTQFLSLLASILHTACQRHDDEDKPAIWASRTHTDRRDTLRLVTTRFVLLPSKREKRKLRLVRLLIVLPKSLSLFSMTFVFVFSLHTLRWQPQSYKDKKYCNIAMFRGWHCGKSEDERVSLFSVYELQHVSNEKIRITRMRHSVFEVTCLEWGQRVSFTYASLITAIRHGCAKFHWTETSCPKWSLKLLMQNALS